ncbi:MAG: hypothetical protein AAFV71_14625 [Cyanobacteria bacterium J06633_8]
MSKPLGYYSLDVLSNNLLKDIAETWENVEDIPEADILWVASRLCHEAWQQEPSNEPPTAEAEEVVDRLHELSYHEKLRLLQWLAQ